jgi:hypothetical protein
MIPRMSDLLAAARRMKAAAGEGTGDCIEKGAKTVPAGGVSIAMGGHRHPLAHQTWRQRPGISSNRSFNARNDLKPRSNVVIS